MRATPPRRLLVTVTLNPNQLRAHVQPITDLDEVERVTVVADVPQPEMAKLRGVVPPAWLVRVLGRAGAKLLTGLVVAARERPDWVLAYNLVPHSLNALAVGAITRRRTLIHLIGGPREWEGGGWTSDNKVVGRLNRPVPLLERVLVWAIRRADVVAVMGTGARRDLIRRGVRPERVTVVPASVDDTRFAPRPGTEPRYDLVTASQLIPRKRLEDLLEATARLRAGGHPGLRVAIAGTGALEGELRAQAERLGIADAVEFLGFVADVERLYAESRVFVLPSRSEGLSIALCEAMATGLPVVATDVGEIRDVVVPGENGELYAVGDVDAFTAHLDAVLRDPVRREAYGRAARATVVAHAGRDRVRQINAELLGAKREDG
jgi:glycosyltransferase involved in cell wall biosynthesis